MPGDPRSQILQMMMQQLAGGEGQMQGRLPDTGFTDMDIVRKMQESQGMMRPGEEIRRGFDEPVPQVAPGMQGGLPPEVMKLAAAGIGPQDVMRGGMMGGRGLDDRARPPGDVDPMEAYGNPAHGPMDSEIDSEDESNVPPMSDEPPHDPRFGPNQDPLRDETEGELASVRTKMGADDDDDGATEWEGDRTPTQNDLDEIKEHPTDENLASFFRQFPDWTAEDILMRGGNPSESPDQYAMDDEEWESTQRDRSTRIEER